MTRTRAEPSRPASREALGMALGLLGMAIFGGTLPATKLALADFSPAFLTFGRAAVAGILAACVLAALRRRLPRRHVGAILVAGVMLVYGFPGLMALAMQTVPAAHGGVVLGILPLATAAFAALIAGERPSASFWGWSVLGAALVVGFAVGESGLRLTAGDAWLFGSGACAALGYVIFGQLSRTMPGWEVISWAMVFALPLNLAASLASWEPDFATADPSALAGFLYAAIFSMFLGFFAWNTGLAIGGIARVSQVQLLQSFVTLALSVLLLGESVPAASWGIAALVACVVWMGRRARIG